MDSFAVPRGRPDRRVNLRVLGALPAAEATDDTPGDSSDEAIGEGVETCRAPHSRSTARSSSPRCRSDTPGAQNRPDIPARQSTSDLSVRGQDRPNSVRCSAWNDPLLGLAGDLGNELEVRVVVQHHEVPSLGGGGDQRVDERQGAVVASCS